ncbi:inositol 2-dehydrogenase [Pontibacillus sp. HMF3514]|uniref:inositol 2-dehydrogenase n=1 Tax=Pontibacillus sp. HMF3514 TaxID=2692425 RepID=UPI001320256D|nr:inositol 2-dehydrogenase [Pontibacillus sp. HMF3514]QHE51699.1 inositol 2-dehydrogenase [Pontibacillus sp. HMF3514]
MSKEKAVVAIIGGGRIGQLHADHALKSDKVELKTLADINLEGLRGTKYEENIPILTTDTETIFNDSTIDAVFICSSTDTHLTYIKRATQTGKHIFCEKPISFNVEETREVLQLVKISGVKFQVGFNRRYDKHFRKVYETIRDGKVGNPHVIKVTSRDPEPPPEEYIKRSGGMFMDMTIHDFDMVRFLSGSEVKDITVKAANLVDPKFGRNGDVDTAIITLTFQDGSLGVIDNSREAVYGYDQRIEVFGDQGVVSADNESPTNVQISTKDIVSIDHPKYFFIERYLDAYIEELDEFITSILENKTLLTTGEDGLKAEMLAKAAQISWEEKRTVQLEELEKVVQ